MRCRAAILVIALCAPLAPTGPVSAACYSNNRSERRFAHLINEARGAGDLRLDQELSKVAIVHTRDMVRSNDLHHSSAEQLRRRVTNWTTLGENVGVGETVRSLHQAFMASPGHRGNIEYSGFRHVGIGAVRRNGRLWVTVVFEGRDDPGSRLCSA